MINPYNFTMVTATFINFKTVLVATRFALTKDQLNKP